MAKISTRQPDPQDESTIEKLQEILHNATNGVVSIHSKALVYAGDDISALLENVRAVIGLLNKTASKMYADIQTLSHDNFVLAVKNDEMMLLLEQIIDVTYDDALDHATADLMDAFAASGGADVTANGELGFDGSVMYSKSDLKPILREAISRYVDVKIS